MRAVYNMTLEIPGLVKRYATLEEKHEDYDRWSPAFENVYVHLKKWLEENEYEMMGRSEEDDRKFLIRDLNKNREGYIFYFRLVDKWEFWMVFE